jgi:hypothetical protein
MFTDDGYEEGAVPDDEKFPPTLGTAEVRILKVSQQAWMARLVNGTLFEFQPGRLYDLVLLTDNGWIDVRDGLLFAGAKDVSHGEFLNITKYESNAVIKPYVIIAARPRKELW